MDQIRLNSIQKIEFVVFSCFELLSKYAFDDNDTAVNALSVVKKNRQMSTFLSIIKKKLTNVEYIFKKLFNKQITKNCEKRVVFIIIIPQLMEEMYLLLLCVVEKLKKGFCSATYFF